ncbi:hypothetical protein [Bacterioplanoides sp.]|uniref:hypothetical protein n=1 Tax=Bacterioplanoides sp. TaxID=2066072 RepID=UPI003AFF70A3
MKRFYPLNAFQALGRTGTRYKCPSCGLLYDSQGIIPFLYRFAMMILMIFLMIFAGVVWGNEKLTVGKSFFLILYIFLYLYLLGAMRPLNPVLYKFKGRGEPGVSLKDKA